MNTLRLRAGPEFLQDDESNRSIDQAAEILRAGGTVAVPTETVYGLAANALDAEAVAKIFAAKQRPGWDPLIVHVCDLSMLAPLVTGISGPARRLIEAFWPGPLTLLLPRSAAVPDAVTAGRPLVGVRMPAHPVALELIRRAGVPIAAPSANRFGHTSPTTAQHVLDDLDGRIDAVIDSGATRVGVESTVIDPDKSPMLVYRLGVVTLPQIRKVAGAVELYDPQHMLAGRGAGTSPPETLPSPGMDLRHYAPRARLLLVESAAAMEQAVAQARAESPALRIGIMLPSHYVREDAMRDDLSLRLFAWGNWGDAEQQAQSLFAGLRWLDDQQCSLIVSPIPQGEGVAAAVRDRLRKAARPAEAHETITSPARSRSRPPYRDT